MRFVMDPFPCPNCGHDILIDGLREIDAVKPGVDQLLVVNRTFDETNYTNLDDPPWIDQVPAWLRALGRAQLLREIIRIRSLITRVRRLRWWETRGRERLLLEAISGWDEDRH